MDEPIYRCAACGDPIDYCQGHGEYADPAGWTALELHDNGVHSNCHPLCMQSF